MKDVWRAVWEHSQHKGNDLLVLLALADYADEWGFSWPGIDTLATKVRMSARNLNRIIATLETSGELIVLANMGAKTASGRTNGYLVAVQGVKTQIPTWVIEDRLKDLTTRNGVTELTPPETRGDESDTSWDGKNDTPPLTELSPHGVTELSGNPSVEPTKEPSEEPKTIPARVRADSSSSNFSFSSPSQVEDCTPEKAWEMTFSLIQSTVDKQTFDRCWDGARLLGVDGDVLIIGVRSAYARDYCQGRLYRIPDKNLSVLCGRSMTTRYEVLPKEAVAPPDLKELPELKPVVQPVSDITPERIAAAKRQYPPDMVDEAVQIAQRKGKRWDYVSGTLRKMKVERVLN